MPLHESIIYYQKLTKRFWKSRHSYPYSGNLLPRYNVGSLSGKKIKTLYQNNRMVAVYKDLEG